MGACWVVDGASCFRACAEALQQQEAALVAQLMEARARRLAGADASIKGSASKDGLDTLNSAQEPGSNRFSGCCRVAI